MINRRASESAVDFRSERDALTSNFKFNEARFRTRMETSVEDPNLETTALRATREIAYGSVRPCQ
jgi:hypothetical protein